jgi:peptidoglycan/LPS O-acetylase OafA/YrhL
MTELTSQRDHYPALDGLRGIAIILVVFFHNFGFTNYFFFGWLGVDLFFVLSGFLITDILIRGIGTKNFLRSFYIKRVLRIFPIYFLLLIIFLIVIPNLPSYDGSLKYYTDNQIWLWTYLQNWLYIFKPIEKSNVLLHLWSLAVEEQYYIIWPFVILLFRNLKILLALSVLLLLSIFILRIVVWNQHMEGFQYFSWYSFTRIDGLCLGSILALLKFISPKFITNNTPYIVLTVAAASFIFYFINKNNEYSFPYLPLVGYSTFGILFMIIVYEAATHNRNLITILLSFAPLRFIGKISYGFYIFHWPVYKWLYPELTEYFKTFSFASKITPNILAASVATVAGFLISVLSFYSFEIRFLKLKKYFR